MKNYLVLLCAVAIGFFTVSCAKDRAAESTGIETRTVLSDHEIIESMGWLTEGIIEREDLYVVEGDIIIYKNYVDSIRHLSIKRQMRYAAPIITEGRENGIRIKIASKHVPDAEWRRAAKAAADIWTNVPNCSVDFDKITKQILAHEVRVEMGNCDGGVAAALPPDNGKPGKKVYIDPKIDWYNDTYEEKVYILVHELGHILGLNHTDMLNSKNAMRHITGTPDWTKGQSDLNSVMIHNSAGIPWIFNSPNGSFTPGDILAIQRLYGKPDYKMTISGSPILSPGKTTTYNLTFAPLTQGYAREFGATVWTVTGAEIVTQTQTSVTIRNNDTGVQLRPIAISASTDFNGYTMSGSYSVNPAQLKSFWEDISGNIHYFDKANTPLSNFKHQSTAHTIFINGVEVSPSQIKKIVFGEGYNKETDAGNYFCGHMGPTVKEIILPKNLTSIGYGSFASFHGNTLMLPSTLTSIGCFLPLVEHLYIGSLDVNNVTYKRIVERAQGTPKFIYADTEALGNAFKSWYRLDYATVVVGS